MNRTEKENTVALLNKKFMDAKFINLFLFQGLNVAEMSSLRNELRNANTEFRVIKNTLARRAIQGTPLENVEEHFTGPTVVALSSEDPTAPAKIFTQFTKNNPKLEMKIGLLDGKELSPQGLEALSKLPSREVLLSQLLGTLQAPASGFVNVLAGVLRKFLGVLQAIEQEKTPSGEP